jgi:hypothetical protein
VSWPSLASLKPQALAQHVVPAGILARPGGAFPAAKPPSTVQTALGTGERIDVDWNEGGPVRVSLSGGRNRKGEPPCGLRHLSLRLE